VTDILEKIKQLKTKPFPREIPIIDPDIEFIDDLIEEE